MKHENILKKVKIDYSQYSKPVRLGCPFCKIDTTHKSRVYKSLKSLLYHLSNEHKQEGNYYPFTTTEIKTLMQTIARSLELGLLA